MGVLGAWEGGSNVGTNCEEVLVTCEVVREREGLGEGEEEKEDIDDTDTCGGAGGRKQFEIFSKK